MVHVTNTNFLTQLSDFLHHLPSSSFVALDLEMTGISLPGAARQQRPNKVELPGERYSRLLKGVPERYSILQVGVALFHENPNREKNKKKKRIDAAVADEHAYMHREGMLNQDELEDLTEREDEGGVDAMDDAANGAAMDEAEESEYTSRIYNFYLFPSGNGWRSRCDEREMTLNPSTVKFLLDNNMDFDRVFREGIPYTTVDQAKNLKRKFFKRYDGSPKDDKEGGGGANAAEKREHSPRRDRVKLTRVEDIAFVARTMAGLREWIDSDNLAIAAAAAANNGNATVNQNDNDDGDDGTDANNGANPNNGNGGIVDRQQQQEDEGTFLVLPPCNAFLRRCLYETIEDEYPGLILERACDNSNPINGEGAAVMRNQIRVVRLSPAEKKRREARLRQEAWDKLLRDIGFTTVFQAISHACNGKAFTEEQTTSFLDGLSPELCVPKAHDAKETEERKIPLVIHNGLQDLMFLLTHCHDATLPEAFEDTKKIIRGFFPNVYDTKVLAEEYSDAIVKEWRTALEPLFDATYSTGHPDNVLSRRVPPIMNQEERGQGQAHEAAWDAFMTGCVFNALCNRILESKNGLNFDLTLDGLLRDSANGLLREWVGMNKLYMHCSLYTIDLESSSGPAGLNDPLSSGLSIDTTFHISGIDTTVSTRDIFQALATGNESEEEAIRLLKYEIVWVDDASFFVSARLVDGIPADDLELTGLIASHVRNALHRSLGDVDILSLGDYFAKKYAAVETSQSPGILSSLTSVASLPFRVLGNVLGLGKRGASDNSVSSESANKRRRLA